MITIEEPKGRLINLESRDNKWCSSLPETDKEIVAESGKTSGRIFKLCGAIGVMTKLGVEGNTIGPPLLRL